MNVVFNIGSLIFYVKLIFVATLVESFVYLSNILWFCLIFRGFVLSVGALYGVLGLCIVRRGFV